MNPLFIALFTLTSAALDANPDDRVLVVTRARLELTRVTHYTGAWVPTSGYPMGDIPSNRGACTDLVIRALRAAGIDLQRLVHEDVVSDPAAYGIRRPDAQIDHRRTPVLLTYFRRHGIDAPTELLDPSTFRPGDIVFYAPTARAASPNHVAIVSDRLSARGFPMLLENGGPRPVESDALDSRPIAGHFRPVITAARRTTTLRDLLAR